MSGGEIMIRKKYGILLGAIGLLLVLTVPTVAASTISPGPASGARRAEKALWADGKIWDTILTPATFRPPKNPNSADKLYVFMNLDGQRSVAEAAPYEQDYDGGRWWVHAVYFTELGLSIHDTDGDGIANLELTSDDQVLHHMSLGHFTIEPTDTYFECPLLPA